MKLKDNFITYENGGDHILMDASSGFSGIVHSNASAAFIVELLKSETSEAEITARMLDKYDASEEEIKNGVGQILDKLRSIGALDE